MDLERLSQRFRQRCSADLETLRSIRRGHGSIAFSSRREELTQIAHKVAGSGGLFGFNEASEKAYALETMLILENADAESSQIAAALDELIATLDPIAG